MGFVLGLMAGLSFRDVGDLGLSSLHIGVGEEH